MKSKPRQRYTAEFKAQAVELTHTGKPVSQIAEELCIGSNLLTNGRRKRGARRAGAKDHEPQARGPKRTTCVPCAAKTPSSSRRTTF
jgi:transposase-like protein